LRELNRKLNFQFPLDGPKTLNGLILEYFEDILKHGTGLNIAGYPMGFFKQKTGSENCKNFSCFDRNRSKESK